MKRYHIIDVDDSKKCIFRVPKVLRRQKSEAYTPDVVSIGPFHYRAPAKRAKRINDEGKEDDLQLMERVKQSYLNEILSHMGNIRLQELIAKVTDELSEEGGGFEERARGFYAEPLKHISSEDFKKMMIVDGCFLIQLFRKYGEYENCREGDDPGNMDYNNTLGHDILLLENQLPWFVIHTLYRLTHDKYPQEPSLSVLILEAFTKLPSLENSCSFKFHCDAFGKKKKKKFHCDDDYLHILDLIRTSMVAPSRTKAAIFDKSGHHQMPTATALSKADIKFRSHKKDKKDKEKSITDIEFEGGFWKNEVLTIPQLNVGMSSETLFRNLIALEQCYHGYSNEITSYVVLMDNLISSKEDMELLRKAQVIGNWLSDEDGCNFFNNLLKGIPHNNFYYKGLCKQVNERCKIVEKRRVRRRRFKYFCYVIIGVFLLQIVPTMLQTAFTAMQYYDDHDSP